ncbi:MAG: hypothetical protein ABW136_00590 [Steroidobacteraceae bacterium]
MKTQTFRALAIALSLIALTGCAASVKRPDGGGSDAPLVASVAASNRLYVTMTGPEKVTNAKDWNEFRGVWKDAAKEVADAEKIGFTVLDGETVPQDAPAVHAKLYVHDYRYLSTGARYGLGVMTGNAYMNVDAEFIELPSGKSLGRRTYNTSSTAWQGVFSAMTSKQVEAVVAEIRKDVQSGK